VPDTVLSPPPGQFLLERVSPAVRRLLVKDRVRAMEGQIEVALQSLHEAVRLVANERPRDAVALGLLWAELLHLDLRHDDALAVMKKVVTPHLPSLTAEERFGVEQNLSDLQFYSPTAADGLFYNVVDQKRLLNFEWLDYRDLFSAKQDAERGKHFQTLPVLWRQHRRAYLHGCWLAQRWTNHLLAKECVHLKEWGDAVHHAMMAQDDTLVTEIAEGILSARQAELVGPVVNRMLTTGNLRVHFVVACKLLRVLEDAIPDVCIRMVGEWLLKRAKETRSALIGVNQVSAAWETITAVSPRFPCDLARSAIAIAVAHPIWTTKLDDPNRVIPERREIVRALVPLSWAVMPEDIPPLATATLPLMTDRPQTTDYDEVVNLLCHLAERGGAAVRDSLAASLYPSGQPVSAALIQVADVFGKGEIFDPVRLQKLADQVAQAIRCQVQWLEPGQLAEPVAEQIMEYTKPKPDRTLKVYIVGLAGLHALARHRMKLDEPTLRKLLDAILDLARNKDNFCANREALLHALIEFADVVPPEARTAVQAALEPLARGPVQESSEYPTAAEADNPLNPFKHHSGRPEDVQAIALVALAALASRDAAATKRVGDMLEDALCDHRPGIRRAGYAAAQKLRDVSEGVILGILAGLRDPDPNAAVTAFMALARQPGWKVNRNHWRVFLMAARLAQRIGGPKLRRHAAAALVAWSSKCPPQITREQEELLGEFSDDICWSVRTVTHGPRGRNDN
jgi:hypothetical protein